MESGSEWATFGKIQFTVFAPYGAHVRKTNRRATYFSIMNIAQTSLSIIFGIGESFGEPSSTSTSTVALSTITTNSICIDFVHVHLVCL